MFTWGKRVGLWLVLTSTACGEDTLQEVNSTTSPADPSVTHGMSVTTDGVETTQPAAATTDDTSETSEASPSTPAPTAASASASESSGDETFDACPKVPTMPANANGRLQSAFVVRAGDEPFVVDAALRTVDGTPFSVSTLGLFLSSPQLETASGELVDAAFVDAAGNPLPYGVLYYLSTDPTDTWRLAAPVGEYVALRVELGIPDVCLQSIGDFPLSYDGGMYWSWGATFMALRAEGSVTESDAGAEAFTYHLGPIPGLPLPVTGIRLEAGWSVAAEPPLGAEPAGPVVELDLAKVLGPKPDGVVIAGHPLTADWAIVNLVETAFSVAE